MIRKIFLDHPTSVGSLACFVHALVPALFPTTGQRHHAIMKLHERVTSTRRQASE